MLVGLKTWGGKPDGASSAGRRRKGVRVQALVNLGSRAPAILLPLGTWAGENARKETKPTEQWFGLKTLPLDK